MSCSASRPRWPQSPPRGLSRNILLDRKNKWNGKTVVSFPGTPEFTNATDRWSSHSEPTFIAGITPATEEDVAKAVNWGPGRIGRPRDEGTA